MSQHKDTLDANPSTEIINSFLHYLSHYQILESDPYLSESLTNALSLSRHMLIQMTTAQLLCDALPGAITPGTWHALALDAWERGPLRGDEEAWVRNGEEMTRRVEAADFDENREESMRQNIADGEAYHVDEEVVEVPVDNEANVENGADWHAVETPDRSAEQGKFDGSLIRHS
jgi:hypothetical protein